MLIKTEKLVQTIDQHLYEYTFNKNSPLMLKGSFKYITYVSDVDYTANVRFNPTFIKILINKLLKLRHFKFLYLSAGIIDEFKVPWVIYPDWGCNFDIIQTRKWLDEFKDKNCVPPDIYDKIYDILTKENLLLGDLIDVQDILKKYGRIRWFLPDILRGYKIINKRKYILLDELKSDDGPVINNIYIYGKDVISIDIGLTDNRYKQPYWSRLYKYYTQNWYKILKLYRKLISKDYEEEYKKVMKTMEYDNALISQVNLLKTLMKYKPLHAEYISYTAQDLQKNLEKVNIYTKNLSEVNSILVKKLNDKAKPYVDYFFDLLTYSGKRKLIPELRLIEISKNPTNKEELVSRRKDGIKCPFFKEKIYEYIDSFSSNLMISNKKLLNCVKKVSDKENILIPDLIQKYFKNYPVSRLFLQYNKSKNKILVRGAFNTNDHQFLDNIAEKKSGYYILDSKLINRIQIYLLTGV
jgi:hypothetical protein